MSGKKSPGESLLAKWNFCSRWPGGRQVFAWLFARAVPYSGSIAAIVQELQPGRCQVLMKDRRRLRNHLNSIHAVALVNLGELCSGLALMSALPAHARGIVTQITCQYQKKARGQLRAECRCDIPRINGDLDYLVEAQIFNAGNEAVAVVQVQWRLGLVPDSSGE